jgi:hypothetical protein
VGEEPDFSADNPFERQMGSFDGGARSLKILGCGVLVVLALLVAAGVLLLLALSSMGDAAPTAVPAQVRQSTTVAVLSDAVPLVTGHVRIRSGEFPVDLTTVLSVGLPEWSAAADPNGANSSAPVLGRDPVVRLSILAPFNEGSTRPCVGPCEIEIPLNHCTSGCSVDVPFQLELVAPGSGSLVRVPLTAAGSVPPGRSLPGGLEVAITIDQTSSRSIPLGLGRHAVCG